MPIYHYRCESCEAVSEVWAKISDPAPESCPECGSSKLKKAVSRTAFKLSGGGWYAQGYDGQSNESSGGAKSDTSGDSGSE
jgi:putative FmdB family regulatory protein